MNVSKPALILFFALGSVVAPQVASAQSFGIGVSINLAPPALPVYAQPPCPRPGYLWTPGYWGYANTGYYWVPGVWVAPPQVGLLWTPGYWGFGGGYYNWHPGFWGEHVGYYGGINYGFGYTGVGFFGGRWAGGTFSYNTAYANVDRTFIRNTYVDRTVVNNTYIGNHYSYNGPGGADARETPDQRQYEREQHFDATSSQLAHQNVAGNDRAQFASYNHGEPGTTAMNSVNGRRYDQQGRIANGVGSGELTTGETKNLENRESNLNGTIRADRSANGGTLTPQERRQVEGRQNNISRSIYDDKHNGAVQQYGNTEVGQRRYDQQQRVAHGIASGQITPRGAANTEQRFQNINRSIYNDRAANGGRLTQGERYNINRRQNGVSRQIYRQKHNAAHAPR